MEKRKVIVIALGVDDTWNPKDLAERIREDVPFFRLTGFAIPTRTSRDLTKQWNKAKDKDILGLYGWRGTAFEMHDWTSGETYLKLRDAWESGTYAPMLFAPDMALSNEAATVVANGDGSHLPPLAFIADPINANTNPPEMRVVPFVTDAQQPGTVGLVISRATVIPKFTEMIKKVQGDLHFIDPLAAATEPKPNKVVPITPEVIQ